MAQESHLGNGYSLFHSGILDIRIPWAPSQTVKSESLESGTQASDSGSQDWDSLVSFSYPSSEWYYMDQGNTVLNLPPFPYSLYLVQHLNAAPPLFFFWLSLEIMDSCNRMAFTIYLHLTGYLHPHINNYIIKSLAPPCTENNPVFFPGPPRLLE